jgi:predicted metal-dependent RNase
MKITLLGAAGGEVTGSAYLVQTGSTNVMVDAGQSDLLNWFGSLASSRPRVILTHGEDGPRNALRVRIQERFGLPAETPAYREAIEF